MHLFEFNSEDTGWRRWFLFSAEIVRFVSFRIDSENYYSLFDCGEFFAELRAPNDKTKAFDIIGFYPDDERLNLYIDFYNEHKDDDFDDVFGLG